MGEVKNRLICFARAAWYWWYEKIRLRWERRGWKGTDNPLVTVYIPTHNRCELLLSRALPSVLNQTYRNLQIIVVAHGCTDDTADACITRGINVIEIAKTDLASLVKAWEGDQQPVEKKINLRINHIPCQATLAVDFARGVAVFMYRETVVPDEVAA